MITSSEIHVLRREVTTVSSRSPRCMVVYPIGKKSRQRIGVGDKNGIMSVFSVGKTMERVILFETSPQKKPVSCATLYEDQLFCVHGSILDAYSRRGRHFFSFDTNVTEAIHTLFVSTPFIICCGSFMATGFKEAKELGFFMSPDRINAMVACVATSALGLVDRSFEHYRCILGCNDRTIRMLSNHRCIDEVHCEAPVTSLCISSGTRRVYYGTGAGSLGCLDLKQCDVSLTRLFSYIPDEAQAAVTAMAAYDINMDGREELLVGRQDGGIHIFYIHPETEDGGNSYLICMWSGNTDEGVLSIAGGFVTHSQRPDMLAHSFSGRITAFHLKEEDNSVARGTEEVDRVVEGTDAQITEVRGEIDAIKKEIITKTQELAAYTGAGSKRSGDTVLLAVSSTFKSKVTLSQLKDSPALLLLVEVDTPLDCVILQSEVNLHFPEKDSGEIILQEEISRNNPLTKTLALIRPLEAQRYSCSVTFWVENGQWGLLRITALSASTPRTAQVKMIQIQPLSLYARVGVIDGAGGGAETKATSSILSTMEVRGQFTARDMHSWIFKLLPGTPQIYQEKISTLNYEDTFSHYSLEVKYGEGAAVFTTESLQTLMVTKRFISYCASERMIEVSFSLNVHREAVHSNLSRMSLQITACNKGCKDIHLLEALQELQGGEQMDILSFPKEYQQLLNQAEQVKKEYSQSTVRKEYLHELLLSLYGSVSECVPKTPKMTPAVREALTAIMNHSDTSEMMPILERLFACDEE